KAESDMARFKRSADAAGDTTLGRSFRRQAEEARNQVVSLRGEIQRLKSEGPVEIPVNLGLGTEGGDTGVPEGVRAITDELQNALAVASGMGELLGEQFDVPKASADAYRAAVEQLIEAGVAFDARVGPQGETL